MRRRSERKTSDTVASPAPPVSRRTSSRRSYKISETEKNSGDKEHNDNKDHLYRGDHNERPSSEERGLASVAELTPRRSRSSRKRTPVNERIVSTKKRSQRDRSTEKVIVDSIPEEIEQSNQCERETRQDLDEKNRHDNKPEINSGTDNEKQDSNKKNLNNTPHNDNTVTAMLNKKRRSQEPGDKQGHSNCEVTVISSPEISCKITKDEELKTADVLDIQTEYVERDITETSKGDLEKVQSQKENSDTLLKDQNETNNEEVVQAPKKDVLKTIEIEYNNESAQKNKIPAKEEKQKESKIETKLDQEHNDGTAALNDKTQIDKVEGEPKNTNDTTTLRSVRKRKWITKKVAERSTPILAISTDSLKDIIADVQPVPLSDVQLESSSEEEGIISEREDGERSSSSEPKPHQNQHQHQNQQPQQEQQEQLAASTEKNGKIEKHIKGRERTPPIPQNVKEKLEKIINTSAKITVAPTIAHRTPSPPRNRASNVLYITNLVRPFTVLQLKGLLARTGKIVEDGFWIDRIKSKCYVAYETEDEAIETRHALHGVRWPVSNPKCLNVDFGSKTDMDRAIQSTTEDGPKFGQDSTKDNQHVSNVWGERNERDEKKSVRPVREWDVGKKESIDRDKGNLDRRRSKERELQRTRSGEHERNERKRQGRTRSRDRHPRSLSISPSRKIKKKENEPPIRLLDDLFRKTKAAPCIYWLPLTPEQIAEKEAIRQKRIEEHKKRVKEREIERKKEAERERERQRERERERDRERENRRNRSNERDRRRSRSRERRRY